MPATAVLVHGGFHGGWCWDAVARTLRSSGWDVFAPSLPGMGEHSHLLSSEITLGGRIQDVVRLLELHDLHDVVLCGHSAGGMVTTGVADLVPDRIAHLVYLDAVVPDSGESQLDIVTEPDGDGHMDRRRAAARAGADTWRLSASSYSAADFGIEEPGQQEWVESRLTDDSFVVFGEPLHLTTAWESMPRRTYVRATRYLPTFGDRLLARFAADPGWHTEALDVAHDMMITEPDTVVAILEAAAA